MNAISTVTAPTTTATLIRTAFHLTIDDMAKNPLLAYDTLQLCASKLSDQRHEIDRVCIENALYRAQINAKK